MTHVDLPSPAILVTNWHSFECRTALSALLGSSRPGAIGLPICAAKEIYETALAEVQVLSERIARLRARVEAGDPDMEPDELEAAIARAEQKRRELLDAQPIAKQSAKMVSMLPRAADAYRRQIAEGLDNDPRAAGKARAILRKLLGPIRFVPDEDGGLWAEYEVQPGALLKGVGTAGSGGPLR